MVTRSLTGTKTHQNLREAFSRGAPVNRREPPPARAPDVEERPDVAGPFQGTVEARAGQGPVDAIADALPPHPVEYARMAKDARDEGFEDIAEWFDTLARTARPSGC